ncbi:hypothetical protein [Sphingomonas sp.]|jgi:hypothetical protein|uniref:hypothetical protein n=1 Tax=Sphingomonas sp. TaxID=28214 RepID=UPI0035679E50
MTDEEVIALAKKYGLDKELKWSVLKFVAAIREAAIREADEVVDGFIRAEDWDADTCEGIKQSILALTEKKP